MNINKPSTEKLQIFSLKRELNLYGKRENSGLFLCKNVYFKKAHKLIVLSLSIR